MTDPEELIDSVLRDYSSAEPSAGWHQRILSQLPRPPVSKWFALAPVFAVSVALILWSHQPADVQPARQEIMTAKEVAVAHESPATCVRRAPVRHGYRRLPKERIFPTPALLSSDERALLALTDYPGKATLSFGAAEPVKIEPLQIPALQIEKDN